MGIDPVSLSLIAGGVGLAGKVLQGGEDARSARKAEEKALAGIERGREDITGGRESALEAIRAGGVGAEEAYGAGRDVYQPYQQAGIQGLRSLQDILGGQPIETSPVFQQQQRLLRQQLARTGQSQSRSAVGQFSAPLIAEEYSRQLGRLQPLLQAGQFGASGAGNIQNMIAQLRSGQGTQRANIFGGAAPQLANLATGAGTIGAATQLATTPQFGNLLGQGASLFSQIPFGGGGGGGGANLRIAKRFAPSQNKLGGF